MSVEWPTRRPAATGRAAPWFTRLPSGDLNLLRAVLHLGAGRVPPWAGDLVADLRAKADAAPEPAPSAPAPAGPRPDDMLRGSADFAAALAAAWPAATPATRSALRTVAAALGVEPPPEPESARVAPDPDPTGDQPTPDPDPAPTAADASAVDPPPSDPEPKPRRPLTVWQKYWDVDDEDDEDPFEGCTPLGWANKV